MSVFRAPSRNLGERMFGVSVSVLRALLPMTLEVQSARFEQHGCGQNRAYALRGTRVWVSRFRRFELGFRW